jgi:hypothetical protein
MEKQTMQKLLFYPAIILVTLFIACTSSGQANPRIGIRGGLGTDINLGIAYGAGVNFIIGLPQNSLELGVVAFGGSFKEDSEEGRFTYHEKTDIFVFGMLANYLIGYTPGEPGLFFVTGIGLAVVNMSWEESSPTDVSLGPLLPGGGSMQSKDGTASGTVFNLGIGGSFAGGFDIRLEIPVILTFAPPGGAASVIPSLMATVGYRF